MPVLRRHLPGTLPPLEGQLRASQGCGPTPPGKQGPTYMNKPVVNMQKHFPASPLYTCAQEPETTSHQHRGRSPFSSFLHSLHHTCDCNSPADAEPDLANGPCAGHAVSADCGAGMGDVLATPDQLSHCPAPPAPRAHCPRTLVLLRARRGLGDSVLRKRLRASPCASAPGSAFLRFLRLRRNSHT